jgi:hypothetical protein
VFSASDLSHVLAGQVVGVGTGTSLADKLAAVLASIGAGDTATACGTLGAFINQVQAQSGKKIPAAQAAALIGAAQQVRTSLGC